MPLSDLEIKIRTRLRDDFIHYAEKCLKIRTKEGDILPFILNKAQKHIHKGIEEQRRRTGFVRAIILKGRQQGCSTYIEGRFYWLVSHRYGTRAFILTHDTEATNNLFDMAYCYHENCPTIMRPVIDASNRKELSFGVLNSGYKIGTAGNKAVGRSATIQLLHGSEVAYWPNASEHAKGILQAVPGTENTEVIFESTANGVSNYFHQQWQLAESGDSDFIPLFVPWFWQDEYVKSISVNHEFLLDDEESQLKKIYSLNNNQIAWRRSKIQELSVDGMDGVKAFKQEYPCTPAEAFQETGKDSLISVEIVAQARKCSAEAVGKLIIGVDPARTGGDRIAIIRRRGRKAYGLQVYKKMEDTMGLVGIIHNIIEKERPDKVCVDSGGLGAPIVDRLWELGHKDIVVAVNSSNTALNHERYSNKRVEMWVKMREWLYDQPCEIPDLNSLHSDLCAIHEKTPDSKGRVKLESKDDLKDNGIRSPDEGDALALTFSIPYKSLIAKDDKKYENIAKELYSNTAHIDNLRRKAYR